MQEETKVEMTQEIKDEIKQEIKEEVLKELSANQTSCSTECGCGCKKEKRCGKKKVCRWLTIVAALIVGFGLGMAAGHHEEHNKGFNHNQMSRGGMKGKIQYQGGLVQHPGQHVLVPNGQNPIYNGVPSVPTVPSQKSDTQQSK